VQLNVLNVVAFIITDDVVANIIGVVDVTGDDRLVVVSCISPSEDDVSLIAPFVVIVVVVVE
jgi:hypothetical protein